MCIAHIVYSKMKNNSCIAFFQQLFNGKFFLHLNKLLNGKISLYIKYMNYEYYVVFFQPFIRNYTNNANYSTCKSCNIRMLAYSLN